MVVLTRKVLADVIVSAKLKYPYISKVPEAVKRELS
jgi:hypothetical protein